MARRHILPIIIGFVITGASGWTEAPSLAGRINYVSGSVFFMAGDASEWVPATINYPLASGDRLATEDGSRAEIHIGSTAIRLDANSELSLFNLDERTVQMVFSRGSMNVRLRELGVGVIMEVSTPSSSESILEPGSYRIDVQANGDTQAVVRDGEMDASAAGAVREIRPDQTAWIPAENPSRVDVTAASPADDWDTWCFTRDQREDAILSGQYVSPYMTGYEDLYFHGTWRTDASYGPVWVPEVAADWAPYRYGHWSWVSAWGWTWIDDAPWGFAPFHYGRWAFLRNAWSWVPGAFNRHPVFSPALVMFFGGRNWGLSFADGGCIGWYPLGPGDVSVPIYQGGVSTGTILYDRIFVPRSVTIMPRDSFLKGEPAASMALPIPLADVGGAPLIAGIPARPLYEPAPRSIYGAFGGSLGGSVPGAPRLSRPLPRGPRSGFYSGGLLKNRFYSPFRSYSRGYTPFSSPRSGGYSPWH